MEIFCTGFEWIFPTLILFIVTIEFALCKVRVKTGIASKPKDIAIQVTG